MNRQPVAFQPVIPEALLSRSDRILFITHLALGDFTYLQNFFIAFKEKYPHITCDLWIDRPSKSPRSVLLDWLDRCNLFNKIYVGFTPHQCIKKARREQYPIVASLCTIRPKLYNAYAKKISPKGFVVGIEDRCDLPDLDHISAIYDYWFTKFFAVTLDKEGRAPFITIPKEWVSYGKLKGIKWGLEQKEKRFYKVIFVNNFANNVTRCWPIDRVVKLILSLRQKPGFEDAYFILNVEPKFHDSVKAFLSNYCLHRTILFTARTNFFELPAIISLCDLVLSVETSIIHLASALEIPVVALMRRKNPEWRPFHDDMSNVIFARRRRDWVEDISLEKVLQTMES